MNASDRSTVIGLAGIGLSFVLFFYGYVGSKYQTLQPCLAAAAIIKERCGYIACGVALNVRTRQGIAEELVASEQHGRLWCFVFVTEVEILSIFQ